MSRPTIIINELDAERIDRLLEQPAFASLPIASALNDELDRAQMCAPQDMPADVVTMNSQVKFRDLTTGEVRTGAEATASSNPAGSAMNILPHRKAAMLAATATPLISMASRTADGGSRSAPDSTAAPTSNRLAAALEPSSDRASSSTASTPTLATNDGSCGHR